MAHSHYSKHEDAAVPLLGSGGVPVIQMGLALENDLTRIHTAGADDATVPCRPVRPGRALTGVTA
jgi:hypothetical protein